MSTNFTKEERNGYFVLFEDLMRGEKEEVNVFPLSTIKERIDYCIENYLKEDDRKAIILRYGLDNNGSSRKMTFKEVGENLGLSPVGVSRRIDKLLYGRIHYRTKNVLLKGDEPKKEFEDYDRVRSHLSEFPYKIYDEDKCYIKGHYKGFYLTTTNLDRSLLGTLRSKDIHTVRDLLDSDIEEIEKRMRQPHKLELTKYVCALITNVVSLDVYVDEVSKKPDVNQVSKIVDQIYKLKNRIKENNEDAAKRKKEISDSNNERNKVLEQEIESLQSIISNKEVD